MDIPKELRGPERGRRDPRLLSIASARASTIVVFPPPSRPSTAIRQPDALTPLNEKGGPKSLMAEKVTDTPGDMGDLDLS